MLADLEARRSEAQARFEGAKPGRKHPRWLHSRYDEFLPAAPVGAEPATADVTFTDGVLAIHAAPDGARVLPLDADDEVARMHLGAAADDDAVHDLHMATWQQGVLIDVQPGANVTLTLTHRGSGTDRVLAHVQDGGRLRLVQRLEAGGTAFVCTELHAHGAGRIERVLFQDKAPDARSHSMTFAKAERDATIDDVHLAFGAERSRNTTIATAAGAGAHVEMNGLYLTAGTQRSDHWTRVDHAVPDTTSRELYKGVLAGESRAAFTGNVWVRQDAQRTNAEQENRNLLLSRKALAESTPQLEIYADDVQCSHGSTVGQLDDAALFFLRARGIGQEEARQMLTQAFAGEVVERIPDAGLRDEATARIETWFRSRSA